MGEEGMMLVDTHAHLEEMKDIEGILKRAQDAGVAAIVAVGVDRASNEKTLELAHKYPQFIYPALGLHPWRLDQEDLSSQIFFIERELPRALALGEVGLDFALETAREKQVEIFEQLLSLARRFEKPVLLHGRRAWEECLDLLIGHKIRRAVFHWYSGPLEVLSKIFQAEYYISATPAVTYSQRHRQAVLHTPQERLLVETDAPEVYQGNASEPKDLIRTLEGVSALWKEDLKTVGERTFRNAEAFFGQRF
jgi:TatD DNase family protein